MTTQPQFSPAPWSLKTHDQSSFHEVFDADGYRVCCTTDLRPMEVNRANATLIAEAPRILGALRIAAERLGQMIERKEGEAEDLEAYEIACLAIAAATGRAA